LNSIALSEDRAMENEWVKLQAPDGHELNAYVAHPAEEPIGVIVLIQEIFGVNAHIRSVADGYAGEGFLVIAPALFDRFERGLELKYEGEDSKRAYELYAKLNPETQLKDVAAAYAFAKEAGKGIAVVGYCYGGLLSWVTATRGESLKMQPSCCVAYYPGGIGKFAAGEPSCPVMIHIGQDDSHIGPDQIDLVRTAHPEVEIFVYKGAGHAFNRDADSRTYNPEAAALARERTLRFLKTHIA
jgi:carboxymethylenebutenolidase